MNTELLNMLEVEDLKGESREMAEVIGLEAFVQLLKVYGGTGCLYIPQPDMVIIPLRDKLIQREFNGDNYCELAKKWELTERYIRDIVQEKARELHKKPMDGQICLFQ